MNQVHIIIRFAKSVIRGNRVFERVVGVYSDETTARLEFNRLLEVYGCWLHFEMVTEEVKLTGRDQS